MNERDAAGLAPLHHAVRDGQRTATDLLLRSGADVHAKIEGELSAGVTALHIAALNRQRWAIERLVAGGADVDARVTYVSYGAGLPFQAGSTPLSIAASEGDVALASQLLSQGAAISSIALNAAGDSRDMLRLLLLQGADPNHVLSIAVARDHLEVAALAMSSGATVHTSTSSELLHYAITRGQDDAVELLLASGAPIGALNSRNEAPMDVARRYNRYNVIELLRQHGAELTDISGDLLIRVRALASDSAGDIALIQVRGTSRAYRLGDYVEYDADGDRRYVMSEIDFRTKEVTLTAESRGEVLRVTLDRP